MAANLLKTQLMTKGKTKISANRLGSSIDSIVAIEESVCAPKWSGLVESLIKISRL